MCSHDAIKKAKTADNVKTKQNNDVHWNLGLERD